MSLTKLYKYAKGMLLVILVIIVYSRSMHYGYNWDDDLNVINNTAIRTAEGLKNIWFKPGTTYQYYPLVFTSFWAEYQLWGLNPGFSHLINVLLHALNAMLLWVILRQLNLPGAYLAASIFALHPVHVESVAWITERKNVLSGFFYLTAFSVYLHSRILGKQSAYRTPSVDRHIDESTVPQKKTRYYYFALFLFCCSLLSKSVTATLPAVILLVLWWQCKKIDWTNIKSILPFFLLSIIFSLNTIFMEKQLGAQGIEWSNTFSEKLIIAGRALWFYAGKLIWPQDICFIYPKWTIDASHWQQYGGYTVSIFGVIVLLWAFRNQIGKGPLTSVMIFCGTLFPALGFFNVFFQRYAYVQDHFQYLASIALIALFASIINSVFNKPMFHELRVLPVIHILMIVALGALTWQEQYKFKNQETLYLDTLEKNPEAALAHNNLGKIRHAQGRVSEAMTYYAEALRLKPDFSEAYYNMGIVAGSQGQLDEALAYYRKALQIIPDYVKVRNNMGVVLMQQGKIEEAMQQYHKALSINPGFAEAHYNLASALEQTGNFHGAIKHYTQAIKSNPDHVDAHNNLGLILANQNRPYKAIRHFSEAVRIKPDFSEAHNNLGLSLSKTGKYQQAVAHYTKALQIKPDYFEAHNNMGTALFYLNKIDEAIFHLQEALRLDPKNENIRFNLNKLLKIKKGTGKRAG